MQFKQKCGNEDMLLVSWYLGPDKEEDTRDPRVIFEL